MRRQGTKPMADRQKDVACESPAGMSYHRRKGFGGFAVVVMLHSRGGAVPLELCPIRLLE